MLQIPPVFRLFSFIGLHSSVDLYAIFRFQFLHALVLGISKMLKECLYSYLWDVSRFISAMEYRSSEPKPYSMVRKTVLKLLTDLLQKIDSEGLRSRKRINFFKSKNGGRLFRLFTETGILGVLEGNNCENSGLVLPRFGEVVSVSCGNSKTAPVTDGYNQYTDLFRAIRKDSSPLSWTWRELPELQQRTSRFKTHALVVFGVYQASNRGTFKRNVLNHVVDSLRHFGSVEYLEQDVFKIVHILFKEKYRNLSRRRQTVMDEDRATDSVIN